LAKKLTKNDFIQRCIKIHNNKYDYSLVEYKNLHTSIKIICPIHGKFLQEANHHMRGCQCPKCQKCHNYSTEEWIKIAKEVHGDKYDYSLVEYVNNRVKIKIICPIHGEFLQTPAEHVSGRGCYKCGMNSIGDKKRKTLEQFITDANKIHNNKYDYSLVEYKNAKIRVKIICPKHGIFEQRPDNHINLKRGCPECVNSIGEEKISSYLKNVKYISQYRFEECRGEKYSLSFDFYLPEQNLCIEYQGEQHFKPIKYFGGIKKFKYQQKNDQIKRDYCQKNGINLLEISYKDFNRIEEILKENLILS
jgi:hypothetical protein